MSATVSLAPLLERFFLQRLIQQRQVSPHTVASYRDTFCRLLKFVQKRLHQTPSQQRFEQITAPLIGKFLDHLEEHDGISIRTRNPRLTVAHSSLRFQPSSCPSIPHRSSVFSQFRASALRAR